MPESPWSKKESNDRKDKFVKAYEEAVKKYDVALYAFPDLVPSGQNGFNVAARLIPMDKRKLNVPSPFQDDKGELAQ